MTLLLTFSPLATALARRGLQDTCFAFFATTAILLVDRCWTERRRANTWLLGGALLAGFLTKESMIFLYPSFLLAGLYYARSGGWRDKLHIAIPFVLAPLLAVALLGWLSGGPGDLLRIYRSYAAMQGSIPYALQYQAGPWFRYLADFLLLSPVVVLLAIAGAGCRLGDHGEAGRRLTLLYLLSGLVVFSALPLLNVRVVLFLEPYLVALATIGLLSLCNYAVPDRRLRAPVTGALAVLVIAVEIAQFHAIFNVANVYDPITLNLIKATGFVR